MHVCTVYHDSTSIAGSWLSLVMLVVGTVLIVVSVVLLVAMGSHVGTRDSELRMKEGDSRMFVVCGHGTCIILILPCMTIITYPYIV